MPSFADCKAISPECPVEATTYGYYPNLGANAFFAAIFGLCTIYHVVVGIKARAWTFTIALGMGAALEMVGYIGRIIMHKNPWNKGAFETQIVCLVLAPSFTAAGIYWSLKHIVLYLAPEKSRFQPRLYPWIFIGCDIGSLVLQAVGGGVAASAGRENLDMLNVGNRIIITGIAFQVATMVACGILSADYAFRVSREKGLNEKLSVTTSKKFYMFCAAETFAYTTVLIRCIYRLPEMAGGWGNPLMQNEKEFLVLDGMMIALANDFYGAGKPFPTSDSLDHNSIKADIFRLLAHRAEGTILESRDILAGSKAPSPSDADAAKNLRGADLLPHIRPDGSPTRTYKISQWVRSVQEEKSKEWILDISELNFEAMLICDEQGPPCSNCTSRELQCSYHLRGVTQRHTRPNISSPMSSTTPPAGRGTFGPNILDTLAVNDPSTMRALELMHKYSTDTYQTLSNHPSDHHVWQVIIPHRALSHDFLMHGILSIASLHAASTADSVTARSLYIDTALEYQSRSLTPFRHAINNVTPSNCDVVFAYSVITIISGIALPQLAASRKEGPDMIENIFVLFELLQGTLQIAELAQPWLEGNLFPSMRNFWAPTSPSPPDSEVEGALNRLFSLNDENAASAGADHHRMVKDAIILLQRCFNRYTCTRDTPSVITWLATIDKGFVDSLRAHDPLSLLVLMYWGVLLAELDDVAWWAAGSGAMLISQVLGIMRADNVPMNAAWMWPVHRVGLESHMNE
ncbi:hypothetical protein FQN55_004025 [Onygenales sp. PD_40]|nr:hypothetical protein FQN55_004025 [Onygenales sp. PD_40]